jgi:hypothetical protein
LGRGPVGRRADSRDNNAEQHAKNGKDDQQLSQREAGAMRRM